MQRIITTLREAEEEAARLFRGERKLKIVFYPGLVWIEPYALSKFS